MDEVNIHQWQKRLGDFALERDWEKFHTLKNLSMAMSVEVAELVEIFQWLDEAEVDEKMMNEKFRESVEEEISDVLMYLMRFSDIAKIDLSGALEKKFLKNQIKYPIEKVKGKSKKYSEY